MLVLWTLSFWLFGVTAVPFNSQRIVGGSVTDIGTYPFGAVLLFSWTGTTFSQSCAATILNYRSVLSAAHCFVGSTSENWRTRVGSSYANSGGVVHNVYSILSHPSYNPMNGDSDLSILRVVDNFVFNTNVRPGTLAGPNYKLPDNTAVSAIGWGRTNYGGAVSEELLHVQVWIINQTVCRSRYAELGYTVTDNMLCSGWLDVGGRDQCQGDSGGPLVHNNVVIGICSWGEECALPRYPGVNVRVSMYRSWIQNNA